jgi:hypothetical protein
MGGEVLAMRRDGCEPGQMRIDGKCMPKNLRINTRWGVAEINPEDQQAVYSALKNKGTVSITVYKYPRTGRLERTPDGKVKIHIEELWDEPHEIAETIQNVDGNIDPTNEAHLEGLQQALPMTEGDYDTGFSLLKEIKFPKDAEKLNAEIERFEKRFLKENTKTWNDLISSYGGKTDYE